MPPFVLTIYSMPYVFDPDRLARLAEENASGYTAAAPYPHAVFENFLRADAAMRIAAVFPKPEDRMAWDRFGARGWK